MDSLTGYWDLWGIAVSWCESFHESRLYEFIEQAHFESRAWRKIAKYFECPYLLIAGNPCMLFRLELGVTSLPSLWKLWLPLELMMSEV